MEGVFRGAGGRSPCGVLIKCEDEAAMRSGWVNVRAPGWAVLHEAVLANVLHSQQPDDDPQMEDVTPQLSMPFFRLFCCFFLSAALQLFPPELGVS